MLKLLLVGADVACTTSALLRGGAGVITSMLDGLRDWLIEHDYVSVTQLQGSMNLAHVGDPRAPTNATPTSRPSTSAPVIV